MPCASGNLDPLWPPPAGLSQDDPRPELNMTGYSHARSLLPLPSPALADLPWPRLPCRPMPRAGDLPLDRIKLPPGFEISVYAEVPGARSLALGDERHGVRRHPARRESLRRSPAGRRPAGSADHRRGAQRPNGVAFRDGSLYVAEISRILRYDNIEAHLRNPPKPVVVTDRFPSEATTAGSTSRSVPTAGCTCRSAHPATSASRTRTVTR